MNTIEVCFVGLSVITAEMIMAELTMAGYESFWQVDDEWRAYIPEDKLDVELLQALAEKYQQNEQFKYRIQYCTSGSMGYC